jgi:hypothetical protein
LVAADADLVCEKNIVHSLNIQVVLKSRAKKKNKDMRAILNIQ